MSLNLIAGILGIFMIVQSGTEANPTEPVAITESEQANALKNLIQKATDGDVRAQLELAVRYRDGKGTAKDSKEAMRWAHLAADGGDAAAMDFVGYAFLRGDLVKRNPEVAFAYFEAAAGKSAAGAWNLGQCYFGGQGVVQNIPKALETWKQAAALGHGRAASTAAMAYLSGEGVPQNVNEALKLATRAAELNDPSGLIVRGELHFQTGEMEQARAHWTKAAGMKPVGPTGHPEQPSDNMAAQQGADLLKLIDYRHRKSEPGKFGLLSVPHVHQGYNNCGATACTTLARFGGAKLGAWDFKRLCPSPIGTGTDWADLVAASEKIDLKWKLITFASDDAGFDQATSFLRSEIDAGRPVVIDFKYIGPQYPNGEAGHTLGVCGYIAAEDLYVLCNPAIASPGLQLMTAKDLKHYWRSDHYSRLSKGVLSRPAIVINTK